MGEHFEQFLQAGLYLRGWSPKTPIIYRRGFACYGRPSLSQAALNEWVVQMRKGGRSAAGCNLYIRAMNAFCSWMKGQGISLPPSDCANSKRLPLQSRP